MLRWRGLHASASSVSETLRHFFLFCNVRGSQNVSEQTTELAPKQEVEAQNSSAPKLGSSVRRQHRAFWAGCATTQEVEAVQRWKAGGAPMQEVEAVLHRGRPLHAKPVSSSAESRDTKRGLVRKAPVLDFALSDQLPHRLDLLLKGGVVHL